jgi:bifunctional enzyme CysN/CysC
MGAFILIDRLTNATVGAGMLLDVTSATAEPQGQPARPTPRRSAISREARAERLDQRPFTLWLTGLPRSGKSSIAYRLEQTLFEQGYFAYVLDGSNVRLGISHDLTFSALDRAENIRRAAEMAKLSGDLGLITIASFVAPFEADREAARQLIGPEDFVEVWCDAPLAVCEARDRTGLYARARAGAIRDFSGISAPYEPPGRPEIVAPTGTRSLEECCEMILARLRELGFLRPR